MTKITVVMVVRYIAILHRHLTLCIFLILQNIYPLPTCNNTQGVLEGIYFLSCETYIQCICVLLGRGYIYFLL